MTRSRRTAAIALTLLAAMISFAFATSLVTVYDGPGSAGVVVGVPCHNVGWEFRGTPGPFADTCE